MRLYHATRPVLLPLIIEEGLRSASGFSHYGGQMGISTTKDLAVVADGEFGNLVLQFDAATLARHYLLRPMQHPSAPREAEVRVIDPDAEETVIPFAYVTALYRLAPSLSRFERGELHELVPGIPLYLLWRGRIAELP